MAFWNPTPPVTPEEQQWVDKSMWRLVWLLGRERLAQAKVVLPTPQFFPDTYDRSYESARRVLDRTCHYLSLDPRSVDLEVFGAEADEFRSALSAWGIQTPSGPAGFYCRGERHTVSVRASKLDDPTSLIATLAHELCHVLLLGDRLVEQDEPDMEPFTDLATVFLGFGVCSGNACFTTRQWAAGTRHGWQTEKLGYLSEEMYGYAIAVFAQMRGESRPAWAKHLSTNVRSYFTRSQKVLAARTKT